MHSFYRVSLTEKVFDKAFEYVRKIENSKPLVNFFVAGTAKGGTTALYKFLDEHPEICMPKAKKELHFFDNDRYFLGLHSISPPYKKYHGYFKPNSQTKMIGESCPSYIWNEKAIERIYEYNPESKIILLLRNPISRAYSHWNMAIQRSYDDISFSDAIVTEMDRIRVLQPRSRVKEFISYQSNKSYLDRGYYSSQIRRLFRFFPKEKVLIFLSEDLYENHDKTLQKIFSFLGVCEDIRIEKQSVHKREYSNKMSSEVHQRLREHYFPEIKSLELLLGRDLSHWLSD